MESATLLASNSTIKPSLPSSPHRPLLCSSCKLQTAISSLSPPFKTPFMLPRCSPTRRLRSLGIADRIGGRRLALSAPQCHIICGVPQIRENEFSEIVLSSDRPVLVEFVADWCGPCRLISPAMDAISQEYGDKLRVVKVDHDANPKLIKEYKVYGLPTLILFKDGKVVPESRREGAISKVKLKEYVDSMLESISVV